MYDLGRPACVGLQGWGGNRERHGRGHLGKRTRQKEASEFTASMGNGQSRGTTGQELKLERKTEATKGSNATRSLEEAERQMAKYQRRWISTHKARASRNEEIKF